MAATQTDQPFVDYKEDGFVSETFLAFDTMRRQKHLCDVTIKLGASSVAAHRTVLAAAIPYFYDMFMSDDDPSPRAEISMDNVEPQSLESLVAFAYTGSVRIDEENMHSMMMAAHILQLESVIMACIDFMIRRQMAALHKQPTPLDSSILAEASANCLRGLTQSVQKIFTLQRAAGANSSFSNTGTKLGDISNHIWLVYPTGRVHSFDATMMAVQSHREHGFLDNYTHFAVFDGMIYSFNERNDRVDMFDPATSQWTTWTPKKVQVLSSTQILEPHIFASGYFREGTGYFYCPKTDTWSEAKLRPIDASYSIPCKQILTYEDRLYTVGTTTIEKKRSLTVFTYDTENQNWKPLGPNLDDEYQCCATVLNAHLYVCVIKYDSYGNSCTNLAFAFDLKNPKWTPIASLLSARNEDMYLVAHMEKLWAISGSQIIWNCNRKSSSPERRIEVYDPETDAWQFSVNIAFGGSVKGIVLN